MSATTAPRRFHVPPVSIPVRVHDDEHLLAWQARGDTSFVLDGVPHELTTGRALWIPAGTRHSLTVHADSVMLPMWFPLLDAATTLTGVSSVPVSRELRTLFLALIQSQTTIIRPAANIARQILALLEDTPRTSSTQPMPASPAAREIAEALLFNPGDDRSVDELAASVHTSPRTIERAFRAETGSTLRTWRIRNRVDAACDLLRSATTVEAVAHRVGYTTASAFRRVFKEHTGMTPGDFLAQYRPEN